MPTEKNHASDISEMLRHAILNKDTPQVNKPPARAFHASDFGDVDLISQPWWWVDIPGKQEALLLESASGLLWDAEPDTQRHQNAQTSMDFSLAGMLTKFRLPSRHELVEFAMRSRNPLSRGQTYRLLSQDIWFIDKGKVDLDSGMHRRDISGGTLAACIYCRTMFSQAEMRQRGWKLRPVGVPSEAASSAPATAGEPVAPSSNRSSEQTAATQPAHEPASGAETQLHERLPDLRSLMTADWEQVRLPELDLTQLTDPDKGLWELWGLSEGQLQQLQARARNPGLDVREANVAIDFGTSSTVVAIDDEGEHKLLRIGVRDFWQAHQATDYENPTVLEFVDLQAVWDAWGRTAYRPPVRWDDVRCSHEALTDLRTNKTDPKIVASTLVKLKQWALREQQSHRLRVTDQRHGLEHELAPLVERKPVKGQSLQVGMDDPFDPIELYAWFLGMTINWRGRGLFLRYYMSFPVAYPREVKDRILASFERGLQRSLPPALVKDEKFSQFCVRERASEPAAYAAVALLAHGVMPTDQGAPYAVFDFGGGTTDFDFGYYRLPVAQEEDEGWEEVFDQLHASGDPYLGGENLLEHLAYQVFQLNLDVCRKHKLSFAKPLDAPDFPGSDMFLERSQAAHTNTLMLMSQLRPLWEGGTISAGSSGVLPLELLNREGEKARCELVLKVPQLQDYLRTRITAGVHNFLVAMRDAFAEMPPCIDVLLAGNASRSPWVLDIFGLSTSDADAGGGPREIDRMAAEVFGENAVEIRAHAPLPMDSADVYRPTAKTGVALGLLRLCPGGTVKVVQRALQQDTGQAPFGHFVGRVQRREFVPVLKQGVQYGQWHDMGPVREGVYYLCHTNSPSALTGKMLEVDPSLRKVRLDLAGHAPGMRLFAQVINPNEIEICSALSVEDIHKGRLDNKRKLALA
jgi:hypothetical protein